MKIIGCDFHPSFQQIAMLDTETGEHTEKRLKPSEAAEFLCPAARSGTGKDGSMREYALVPAPAGQLGA
jgi:hypothetical protein